MPHPGGLTYVTQTAAVDHGQAGLDLLPVTR